MTVYALANHHPQLPPVGHYWIAPSASVIGRVIVGENVGIWFGAVLRGDNEEINIGCNSNVQDGVVVHTDLGYPTLIGENCTIGHNAIIHGCTIGANSLIGMGATILNGAVIGKNCLVGANALITQDKSFPDNSLILGSPAKAVRTIDDDSITNISRSAKSYSENWKRFARDLKMIKTG